MCPKRSKAIHKRTTETNAAKDEIDDKKWKERKRDEERNEWEKNARETADTSGEGETLPDPQGAGVPA